MPDYVCMCLRFCYSHFFNAFLFFYFQEALHREQVLENKLGTLQKVVANTQDESDIGWKVSTVHLLFRNMVEKSQI